MSMKPFRRAVAVTGKYTDREGREKSRYQNVGTLFKGDGEDEGRFSLKMEALPLGEWNGWLSFFEIEDRREGASERSNGGDSSRSAARESGASRGDYRDEDPNDPIPF